MISGGRYFSTPWTRYSLNTDGRTQKLESNMEDGALENSVTIENLVLLYLELLIIEMEVVVDPCLLQRRKNIFFIHQRYTSAPYWARVLPSSPTFRARRQTRSG